MVDSTPGPLAEIVRVPSPVPFNQSLAHDGERLWVGCYESSRLYALDPRHGNVVEEHAVPGKPIGSTVVGNELRFVLSEGEGDDRWIRRFVPGRGFTSRDALRCPDDTGSFLACDGARLWLTQRYAKRLLELDAEAHVLRAHDIGEEIIGATWVGDRLYFSLWLGKERGGCRIGTIAPTEAAPSLHVVAVAPFVAVSLAYDGERLWTNDYRRQSVVAFAIPAAA